MTAVLELGKAGTAGVANGELPVLRDGAVVAVLRAANWKEAATAVIGEAEWVYAKAKGTLTARRATDPEGTALLTARQTSMWKGTWGLDLAGTPVELQVVSFWKGAHRYLAGGRQIAESGSTGGWSPRPTLTADELPLEQQVFLLWVELVISRRNTATVTAATGAAVIGGSS
ncbi:hypothetical protein ACI797_08140 [Geodermatophilus sp. SYSU D00691]